MKKLPHSLKLEGPLPEFGYLHLTIKNIFEHHLEVLVKTSYGCQYLDLQYSKMLIDRSQTDLKAVLVIDFGLLDSGLRESLVITGQFREVLSGVVSFTGNCLCYDRITKEVQFEDMISLRQANPKNAEVIMHNI